MFHLVDLQSYESVLDFVFSVGSQAVVGVFRSFSLRDGSSHVRLTLHLGPIINEESVAERVRGVIYVDLLDSREQAPNSKEIRRIMRIVANLKMTAKNIKKKTMT